MAKNDDGNQVKNYTRRDSATSMLRKMGIPAADYDKFIAVRDDGTFDCFVANAAKCLAALNNPKGGKKDKAATPKAETPKAEKPKTMKDTISSVARELILKGLDNQGVWEGLKKRFNLDDSKKHYPTWYRCEMKRKGLL